MVLAWEFLENKLMMYVKFDYIVELFICSCQFFVAVFDFLTLFW